MADLFSVFWIVLDMLSMSFFCDAFLSHRKRNYFPVIFFTVGLLTYFIKSSQMQGLQAFVLSVILVYIAVHYFCKGNWSKQLLVVIMGFLLIGILDVLTAYGGSTLLMLSLQTFCQRKLTYVMTVTTGKLLALLTAWMLWHFEIFKHFSSIQRRWIILTLLFPVVSLLMLAVTFGSYQGKEDLSLGAFIFSCALAVANVAILYLLAAMEKETRNKQEIILLNQQMEIQTQNIISLEKSYRAQRTASHEFSHHLQMISNLLDQHKYENTKAYVQNLQGIQTTRLFEINSHHPLIDALLNQKYQFAKEKGIEMQVRVNDLSSVRLPPNALVVMLSNLLDNAIEATEQCYKDRVIHCSMLVDSGVFLSIENTSNQVDIVDGKIASTKLPKEDHGYGLVNVQRILQDLHAEYTYCYSNGWFRFVAEIPIP